MCATCGCETEMTATIHNLQTGASSSIMRDPPPHRHEDGHEHDHQHPHTHGDVAGRDKTHDHGHVHEGPHHHADDHDQNRPGTEVNLDLRILAKNDASAAKNRAWFAGREILVLNLVSAPGAGKTTLLERTIRDLREELCLSVIEGDQATSSDGERILAAGAPVVQVNTGAGCHLDADMVARGITELKPATGAVILIENVGNLVCPALFDLGERAKVVILSVTEGEDKPLKYPHMFRAAKVMILNKTDLLPHLDFDVARVIANAKQVNPEILVLQVSARTCEGLDTWYAWLRQESVRAREEAFS